jgi:hypothetical protein
MLNPSDPQKNLSLAIPANSATPFKVLLAGQKLSPGVVMKVGFNAGTDLYHPVYEYQTDSNLTAATVLSSATTYVRTGADNTNTFLLADMLWNMPLNVHDAELAGNRSCTPATPCNPTSLCRVGLVPGVTGCVTSARTVGVVGEPAMNGALTMQIIDANTPAPTSTQRRHRSGHGLEVKKTAQAHLLARYVVLACRTTRVRRCRYNPNPPADTSAHADGSPPSGSGDPSGEFNGSNNAGGVVSCSTSNRTSPMIAMWSRRLRATRTGRSPSAETSCA